MVPDAAVGAERYRSQSPRVARWARLAVPRVFAGLLTLVVRRMILQALLFTKLGPPFETPSGGAWDDQITYNFTTDPEYTDVDYVNHYRDL